MDIVPLVDTGNSESFIAYDYIEKNRLNTDSASRNVSMASSSLNSPLKGLCTVEIKLLGKSCPNTRLSVLVDLCCDVIQSH